MSAEAKKPAGKQTDGKSADAKSTDTKSAAVIRDRGYQRWEGKLTAAGSRFGLIAGRMLKMTARRPWVIVMFILPALPMIVYGVLIWGKVALLHGTAALGMKMQANVQLPFAAPDTHVFDAIASVWTAPLLFLMAMFAGGGSVADDARAGAFQFYFARPVTREQYLVGKLLPPIVMVGIVAIAPGVVLGGLRVALASSGSEAMSSLWLPAKAIAFGALNAVVLGSVVVALSSLAKHAGYVQGGFAGLYFLPWIAGLTFVKITRSPWPSIFSLRLHLYNVGRVLFDIPVEEGDRWLPATVSLGVLAAVVVGAVLLLRRRLAAVEVVAG